MAKFLANVQRDQNAIRKLRRSGWKVAIIWECQVETPSDLRRQLRRQISRVSIRGRGRNSHG